MYTNKQEEQEEDDCSICLDRLPRLASKFVRMTCCGKGMHIKCRDGIYESTMSYKQKVQCIMCRTEKPDSGSAGYEEVIQRLRRWIDRGKAWAQDALGQYYEGGRGVEQSYQQARELYELSASQGFAMAQFNLGRMYGNGLGVDQSYEKAAEYHEAAARQGYTGAQYNLGYLYLTGKGIEQCIDTGREWLLKAAEQGYENAIITLQQLDEVEERTTPSFTPPKRCSTCNAPETPSHKINDCPCFGAQYCNAKCQKLNWKSHKKEHYRLSRAMNLKNTEGEQKETATVDLQQGEEEEEEEEEEDECPV